MDQERHSLTPVSIVGVDGPFVTIAYDTCRWPFADALCQALGVASLRDLPQGDPADPRAASDLNQQFRRQLAALPLDAPVMDLYRGFAEVALVILFGSPLSHTQRPVLRVQVAHSPSISAPHRDVDYTERWDYLNVWLPMVDVPAELGLRVESSYGAGTMTARALRYGQALLFDGSALEHFSPANTSDLPRVSMDFRFSPRRRTTLSDRLRSARPEGIESVHRAPAPASAKTP